MSRRPVASLPRRCASLVSLAALLAGCGGAAAPAAPAAPSQPAATQPAPAQQPVSVNFRLPWLVAGYDGAFYVAQAQGFYKQQGIDIHIEEGKSSTLTVESVAHGDDPMGFADAGTAAQLISKGATVKVVAVLTQVSPLGMIYNPGTDVSTVQALKGKTIIANAAGGPQNQLLPALLKTGGLSQSDVHLDLVAAAAEASTFKQNPKDILLGFCDDTYPEVLKLVPEAKCKTYADFDPKISPLNLGIIANTDYLKSHPDVVKKVVAASIQGWTYAMQHVDETVAATLKADPKADQQILKTGLEMAIPLTQSPAAKGKPIGWMADSDWQATLDLLHTYAGMQTVKAPSEYYTNEYVPQSGAL